MVTVYGPMLSLDASGTIAQTATFSKWKGRNYVRQRVVPANPQSGPQTGMRAMMRFLAQNWSGLTAAEQATWLSRSQDLVASEFNAFCSLNMRNWRNFLAPSKEDPPARGDTAGVYANEAATAGVRQIDVEIEVTTLNNAWACAIFRAASTGFSTAFSNCIAVILTDTAAVHHYIDTPLAAGTYYYNFRGISEEGILNAEEGEVNATVT